jgi:hypothetical protein
MKILRFAGRDIVKTELAGASQGFYRSTGRNSQMPMVWLPFDRLYESGWFDKSVYADYDLNNNKTPLHRFGTHLNRGVSRILGMMNIPEGNESNIEEVNKFLGCN